MKNTTLKQTKLYGERHFYHEVQSQFIHSALIDPSIPKCTLHNESFVWLTPDRMVFYFIPRQFYFLDPAFIEPQTALFGTTLDLSTSLGLDELHRLHPTNLERKASFDDAVYCEFTDTHQTTSLWCKTTAFRLFPNERTYCAKLSTNKVYPVIVLSSLGSMLGGCWPIKL